MSVDSPFVLCDANAFLLWLDPLYSSLHNLTCSSQWPQIFSAATGSLRKAQQWIRVVISSHHNIILFSLQFLSGHWPAANHPCVYSGILTHPIRPLHQNRCPHESRGEHAGQHSSVQTRINTQHKHQPLLQPPYTATHTEEKFSDVSVDPSRWDRWLS